jgi:ferredoxin
MAFIVTENCKGCRFTDCVETCPVACFHGDGERLYIDPKVCIDCAACLPACPVRAIHDQYDMPAELEPWIAINAEKAASLPVIDSKQDPQPGADVRKAELGY